MNIIKVHNIEEYNTNINRCFLNEDALMLSWELRTKDELLDPKIRAIFKSNVSICDEAIKLLEKSVIYSGHEIGVLKGVEITEGGFYWIVENPVSSKEIFMSCVGKLEYLDIKLVKAAVDYENIEKINNTSLKIAFMNGAIWRESNPTPETIQRILDIAWEYREDNEMTELEYILKNFKQ